MWSGKCPVKKCLFGEVSVGEVSVGELSGRETVHIPFFWNVHATITNLVYFSPNNPQLAG